jgi:hypothetical protein
MCSRHIKWMKKYQNFIEMRENRGANLHQFVNGFQLVLASTTTRSRRPLAQQKGQYPTEAREKRDI